MTREEQNKLNEEFINACSVGKLHTAQRLLKKGADVDARDILGGSALGQAVIRGHLNVVRYLIEKAGAFYDDKLTTKRSLLNLAVLNSAYEVAKYLFLERDFLMPVSCLFMNRVAPLLAAKQGKRSYALNVFDYFLQRKSNYTPSDIEEFKDQFSKFQTDSEYLQNVKAIVKFL